jgi:flagellar basal-body rod protein FlgG
MFEAKMIAATGLHNQQRRLDTIANNVANINSTAFKGVRLDFKDALYTNGIIPGRARTPEGNQQKGHGVMVAGTTKDFRVGSIQITDRPLDFAIEGEGFFSVRDMNGNIFYTRNGAFNISAEFDGAYIVNGDGLYVLDDAGERIRLPAYADTIHVETDGTIRFVAGDEEGFIRLGVFTFRNLTGLHSEGGGLYSETDASGDRFASDAVIRQGSIEGSNVNLAEEMTRMIRTQRAFQLASRALTTADEMEGIANNMRR